MAKSLNWLVIGVGDITTKRVIPGILAESRSSLWGILTRDPAKAAPYGVRVFTDLAAALADEGGPDAVYVASPVALHAPQTLAGLRAGKHVLCEKPFGMNYLEAQSMVQAARDAGRTLGVAFYRRMYPKLGRARQLLREGVIGQPLLAYVTCHEWRAASGHDRNWLYDPALAGGGALYDIGSHRIDVLNYLFGEPRRVVGQTSNAVHPLRVEDCATVMIEYSNHARGIVDVRWNSHLNRDECRIIGTDGEMDLTPLSSPALVYPGGREELPVNANVHLPCLENFVAAVLDAAPLASSGESAAWTDWVTEQVVKAQPGTAAKQPK